LIYARGCGYAIPWSTNAASGSSACRAVLHHHGLPQRRELLRNENRAWVEELPLPAPAREQITVALALIDSVEVQLTPLTDELRAYARRQAGLTPLQEAFDPCDRHA
jgi:hypothetical protein